MGGQNSKGNEPKGNLTQDDIISLKKLFNTFTTEVAAINGEKVLCCVSNDFKLHCEGYLDPWLVGRIVERLSVKGLIPLNNFLSLPSTFLKGGVDEKVNIVWRLASVNTDVTGDELLEYTGSVVKSYLKCSELSPQHKSWVKGEIGNQLTPDSIRDYAEYLLRDLLYRGIDDKAIVKQAAFVQDSFSQEEFEKCFASSTYLQTLHSSVISCCFRLDVDTYYTRVLPKCQKAQTAFLPQHFSILDEARIMFLNAHLPPEMRNIWRFLFSTAAHGESFAKMVGNIEAKGSTIIIIQDDGGRIFGGFGTDSWEFGPKFFGQKQSFLFHLSPKFVVYNATGFNENFQYFNVQQQTFPNGLGFGGALNYFGIWIDAEFGKGKSSPSCTTYHSPQLSTEEFNIHHVEVWGVGPEPKKDENERGERSILDKDPDAKALLEMTNRGFHSDGYREDPHCDE